ncbi:hypothetical protein ACHHYP_13143 [Achlya hypogyna]|uniref:BEACH domain-containing protein n=1 Tax=Achlya hypogyna TaxID=1202772 RepID=A0A1V9YFS3_ACHHY|nr:hypothetical protein ACHHYP_13143 [Achlya hypogyna]
MDVPPDEDSIVGDVLRHNLMGFELVHSAKFSISDVMEAPPSVSRSFDSGSISSGFDETTPDGRRVAFAALWERYSHLALLPSSARPEDDMDCFLNEIEGLQLTYRESFVMSAGDWPLGALEIVVDQAKTAIDALRLDQLAAPLRIVSKAVRWKRNQAHLLRTSTLNLFFEPMATLVHTYLVAATADMSLLQDVLGSWTMLLEVCFVGSTSQWKYWADVDLAIPDGPLVAAQPPSSLTRPCTSTLDTCLAALDAVNHEWTDYFFDSKKPAPMGFLSCIYHTLPGLEGFAAPAIESVLTVLQATRAFDVATRGAGFSTWIPRQLELLEFLGAILCVRRSNGGAVPTSLLPRLFDLLLLDARLPGSPPLLAQETLLASLVIRVGLEVCASLGTWLVLAEKLSLVGSTIRWIQDVTFQLAVADAGVTPERRPTWALTQHAAVLPSAQPATDRLVCYGCQHHRDRWRTIGLAVSCPPRGAPGRAFHQANLCYRALFDTLYIAYASPAVRFLDVDRPVDLALSPVAAFLEHTIVAALDLSRAARRHATGVAVELHAACFLRHAFQLHPQSTAVPRALLSADAWPYLWYHPALFATLSSSFSEPQGARLGDIAVVVADVADASAADPAPRGSLVLLHAVVADTLLLIVHALPEKARHLNLLLDDVVARREDPWFIFSMAAVLDQLALTEGSAFDAFFLGHFTRLVSVLGPAETAAARAARLAVLRLLQGFVTAPRAVTMLREALAPPAELVPALYQLLHDPPSVGLVLDMLPLLLDAALVLLFDAPVPKLQEAQRDVLYAQLFQLFAQSLSELISSSREGVGGTVRALVAVLGRLLATTSHRHHTQVLLRDCGIFVHLTNLLHSRHYVGTPVHADVVRSVGTVLTLLLTGNRESKAEFRQLLGATVDDHERAAYEPLVHVVLAAEATPSLATMDMLWTMMVDADAAGLRIHNPDAVPVLWSLLRHCTRPVQDSVVGRFLTLFSADALFAVLNRAMCCYVQPATLDQIMDLLEAGVAAPGLLDVMVEIGQHSIGAKQLKRLFRLLQRPAMGPLAAPLVAALGRMAAPRRSGPSRFFFLDGVQSGLAVAANFTFPTRGWTFHTWLRLEECPSRAKHTLLSIRDGRQRGYHLYVQAGVLCYALPDTVVATPTALAPHRWYCVSFAHTAGSFRARSEALLCLDGTIVWRADVPALDFGPGPVASCHVGCDAGATAMGRMRLGAVFLFKKALAPESLGQLHRLGPDIQLARPDPLLEDVAWSYNASVWEGQFFFDCSAHVHEAAPLALAARRLDGTYHVYTRRLVDVLDCLGGLAVVFPLLAQFDFAPGTDLTANMLALLGALQRDHVANQRLLDGGHGVRVIAYLLGRMAPHHRTCAVLDTMRALLVDTGVSRSFQSLVLKHWLGNFHLWAFAALDVQLHAVATLRWVVDRPELPWNSHLTVRKLLDDLRLHYWFTPPTAIWASEGAGVEALLSPSRFETGAAFNSKEWCHPETHTPVAAHLSAADCHRVRGALLELLEAVVRAKPAIEPADVAALLGFLAFSGDDVQKRDGLRLLHVLLAAPMGPELAALAEREVRKQVNTPDANLHPHYRITPWSGFGAPLGAPDAVVALVLGRPRLTGDLKLLGLSVLVQLLSMQQAWPSAPRPHSVSLPTTVLATALAFKPRLATSHTELRFESHLRRLSSYSFSEPSDDARSDSSDGGDTDDDADDSLASVYVCCALVHGVPRDCADSAVHLLWAALAEDRRRFLVPALFAAMNSASRPVCLSVFRGLLADAALLRFVGSHRVHRSWIGHLQSCGADADKQIVLEVIVAWSAHCVASAPHGWRTALRFVALLEAAGVDREWRGRYQSQLLHRLRCLDQPSTVAGKGSKWQYLSSDPSDADRQHWFVLHANMWHLVFVVEDELFRAAPASWATIVTALVELLQRLEMLHWVTFPVEVDATDYPWMGRKGGVVRAVLRLLLPRPDAVIVPADLIQTYVLHEQFPHARQDLTRYVLRALAVAVELCHLDVGATLRALTVELARRHRPLLQLRFFDLQAPVALTPTSEPLLAWLQEALQLPTLTWEAWKSIVPPVDTSETDDLWAADMVAERQKIVAAETLADVHLELLTQLCHRHRYGSETMEHILTNSMQWERSVWKYSSDAYEKQLLHASHTWQRILRSLTNERASWGYDGTDVAPAGAQWKLDGCENARRERCKLKRYYAQLQAPTASTEVPAVVSQTDAQLSLATELLQAKALAAYNEDFYQKLKLRDEAAEPTVVTLEGKDPGERIATFECGWVAKTTRTSCHLHLYPQYLGLVVDATKKQTKLPLAALTQVEFRQYQFRPTALECFFRDGATVFLSFADKKTCGLLHQTLRYMQPPGLRPSLGRTPRARFEHSSATQLWIERKLSNFDYLMHLNTIAGRTYNDLAQYPVFPWVLADYTSETLDLTKPSTFRDLSRPIGVQQDASLAFFTERYKVLDMEYQRSLQAPPMDDDMPQLPPFHYGTHYSCSAFVIGFLLRLQPFTTYHLQLQGGKLDHADRLFHSVEAAYRSCTSNPSDVRELIPEFYCLPEFLLNTNGIALGVKQNGDVVDDVVLPPWAKGSAHEFIRLHRLALESDYVSAHLHHWIDLVFGFKQRPPLFGGTAHAVDACNVYFHLTYDGAVDLDKLQTTDPQLYATTLRQMDCFGQTPSQLLFRPHPARMPATDCVLPIVHVQRWVGHPRQPMGRSRRPILCLAVDDDAVVAIDATRGLALHRWKALPPDHEPPFTLAPAPSVAQSLGVPFATHAVTTYAESALALSGNLFAVARKYVFSCGHWDHSIKATPLEGGGDVQSVRQHHDVATCIAVSEDARVLVTGASDNTVMVWPLLWRDKSCEVRKAPSSVLYGHDDGITSVAVSSDFNLVLSASRDGTVIVHTLSNGRYIRSLRPGGHRQCRLSYVGLSKHGSIVTYCDTTSTLYRYSINGDCLASAAVDQKAQAFALTSDGDAILVGGRGQYITVYRLHDLEVQRVVDGSDDRRDFRGFQSPIHALCFSPDEMHLLVGLGNGDVCVFTPDAQYLRDRLQTKLTALGF